MITRLLFFAYGLISYVIFLATFLYGIAFVGGFIVPTRLDGALRGAFAQSLLTDAGLVALFAVQHSVMARRWFKKGWTRIVPVPIERSTFVLFASLALAFLFWRWRPLGDQVWLVTQSAARMVLWILFAFGWAVVLMMTFVINHFDFFGVRQVWLFLSGKPYTRVKFATMAPYHFVRHPLHLGFLIAFWSTPNMTLAHLVFAVATTAYIVIGIHFEERDLLHEYGNAYQEYRERTPMLLPSLNRERK